MTEKPVTTFPDEKRLITCGQECLVSATVQGKTTLIASDGFRTDYPVLSGRNSQLVVEWDSPSYWSAAFKQLVRQFLITQISL